jgi:hypothetical protein
MTRVSALEKQNQRFGGELPVAAAAEQVLFTDSGRSSLRHFVRQFQGHRFAIPDFTCEIVVKVLQAEGISLVFYPIGPDLKADFGALVKEQFDVLYRINYFGRGMDPVPEAFQNKIILDDHVFVMDFSNLENLPNWYGFNSFRKVSALADGSMVKTNLVSPMSLSLCQNPAAELKYRAKELKQKFIFENIGSESDYLSLFNEGEECLDQQQDVCSMSGRSHFLLLGEIENYDQEIEARRKNFAILRSILGAEWGKLIEIPHEPSFFVIGTPLRDALRKNLMSKNIFLPVHWPQFGVKNSLYQELISIPVFGFYGESEIERVACTIKEFLSERR